MITSRKGLWKGGPFKALTEGLSRSGGRNAHGLITARHRGGGHRKVYRQVRLPLPAAAACRLCLQWRACLPCDFGVARGGQEGLLMLASLLPRSQRPNLAASYAC